MSEQAVTAAEQTAMPKHGEFCWNDLATTDVEACKKFYGELFGWQFKESEATGMAYAEITVDNRNYVGGMWQTDQCGGETSEMPPPHWMTYIAVDDVDASAAKVTELGGSICVPPTDIPNTGRFAVINDPTGAIVSMITLK